MTPVPACIAASALALSATPALGSIADRIYNPPTAPLAIGSLGHGARLISVRTTDGLDLTGIAMAPRDKPVLLVLHGSGTSAQDVANWLSPLADRGYGLVLAEYRGFSGNAGKPNQAGLTRDALAFLQYARLAYPGHRIIVVGHSLGGGVAFDLALADRIDALLTIGTFARLHDLVPRLARTFVDDRYDNVAALRKLDASVPYFIVHGTADETVSPAAANRLHNLAVELERPGASLVLDRQRHRPDAQVLAAILDLVSSASTADSAAPPAGVAIAPFRADGRLAP